MAGEQRKLAAILAADVVGYSKLVGSDEIGTLALLQKLRADLIEPAIAKHSGRLFKAMGDGFWVEFASAVQAVTCGRAIQQENRSGRLALRIGIHLGDVVVQGEDLMGDGINIAARIEGIAEPGGISISEDVWRQVQGKVPANFVDTGEQSLKNIARPVRVYRLDQAPKAASVPEAPRPILPPPDKPSIAVLSFTNMTDYRDQEYFGDGIAEDIITMLSRSQSLFVIARNSSFTYKGRAVDVKQIARELGVRYVLEGSVRRGGNRVRITAQLIDAETGNHLWAERYDRDLVDIFAVQDEITEAVAIAIGPAVAQMEQWRAVRKPPESLGAWEAYQRGLWHSGRIGATENEAAKTFFQRAIDLDPHFAAAHAELANTILREAWLYQTRSMVKVLDEALAIAQKAISLDPMDVVAHCSVGTGRFLRGDHAGALAEACQALIISPNYAGAHHSLGSTLVFSGHPREGIEALRTAMRLDPNDLHRHVRLVHISMGHYFLREYDAAVDFAKQAVRSYPDLGPRSLAAALGQAGRFDEAKQALQEAIAVAPKSFEMYVRQRAPWFRSEDYNHMLEGLRKAGWGG